MNDVVNKLISERELGRPYQVCVRCIMDTSDNIIEFDSVGVCSHCKDYDAIIHARRPPPAVASEKLAQLVEQIKVAGRKREYDCVVGVSGGVDSSYLLVRCKEFGLRPLAVHLDCGWNSELAVKNIENLVKRLDLDLFTIVVDWEEMRDLQVSYLKAGFVHVDVPTDHAIFASLYHIAAQRRVRYIVSGQNLATEAVMPTSWGLGESSADLRQLRAVQRRHGTKALKDYPQLGFFERYFLYRFVMQIRSAKLLDLMPYVKDDAKRLLQEQFGWRDYGGKHHESVFTKFFQTYYLPFRFGYDKRRPHLSNMVLSGQMTRDAALVEVARAPCTPEEASHLKQYVVKKLRLTDEEFEQIMAGPPGNPRDYPSIHWLLAAKAKLFPKLQSIGVSA